MSITLWWVVTCITEAQLQFHSSHRFEASISLYKDFEYLYSDGYVNFLILLFIHLQQPFNIASELTFNF